MVRFRWYNSSMDIATTVVVLWTLSYWGSDIIVALINQ
jgi:hypothetical protein